MVTREYSFIVGPETATLPTTATPSAGVAAAESGSLNNHALSFSVSASAATIALKTRAGTDPTATDYVSMSFRSATPATGTPITRTVTAALSTVISSGSTAGHSSGVARYLYIYALDNSGTVELAWSSSLFDDGSVQSTTAEGGAGGADSAHILYSTTARSNVSIRLLGRIKSSQATAGTWASAPIEISLPPFNKNLSVISKTTTYSATLADDVILASTAGGTWTLSLFAASGNSGKVLKIKKTNSEFDALVIDPNASETIDGAGSYTLYTLNEEVTLVCDGSNWVVLDHKSTVGPTAYTPVFSGFGTESDVSATWERRGKMCRVVGLVTTGTVGGSEIRISLPGSFTVGSAYSSLRLVGQIYRVASVATMGWSVIATASVAYVNVGGSLTSTGANLLTAQVGTTVFNNSEPQTFLFEVPIAEWEQ
jgi:hypothetical protein